MSKIENGNWLGLLFLLNVSGFAMLSVVVSADVPSWWTALMAIVGLGATLAGLIFAFLLVRRLSTDREMVGVAE